MSRLPFAIEDLVVAIAKLGATETQIEIRLDPVYFDLVREDLESHYNQAFGIVKESGDKPDQFTINTVTFTRKPGLDLLKDVGPQRDQR